MLPEPTPLMRQYREMKQRHPDALLFFRVGDFYEMFYDDAVEGARLLDIALTSRDKTKSDQVPLCGVPAYGSSCGRLATGSEGTLDGSESRPLRTWHMNDLPSCMLTLGSVTMGISSLAWPPVTSPA